MGAPTVRPLSLGDRDAALDVINTAARWYREFLPPEAMHDPEMTAAQWEAEAPRLAWYGVFVDGKLIGVGALAGSIHIPASQPLPTLRRVASVDAEFVLGSAVPHDCDLVFGSHSVQYKHRGAA